MPVQVSETIGFIMINRTLFNHPLWKEHRTFSKCEAWVDLIRRARFEQSEATELINGKLLRWGRGELVASVRFLAGRWDWGKSKVADFLKFLEEEKMITRRTDQGETIITLLNFDVHNPLKSAFGQKRGQQKPPPQSNTLELPDTEADNRRTGSGQGPDNTNKDNKEEESNTLPDAGHGCNGFSSEQYDLFNQVVAWIKQKAPRVMKMPEPLTIDQYFTLKDRFPDDMIADCFLRMHNWKTLKDRQSTYLTFLTFAERRQNES